MTAATPALPPAPAPRFIPTVVRPVVYPDSDGLPIADNTLQFKWISMVAAGFHRLFHGREDVFVASDLLWYYQEGNPKARIAPDTMIVFGVQPGERGSYKQWVEGGIAPQVVFEILSPSNSVSEMRRKTELYNELGVEEYYEFNPDTGELDGYQRRDGLWTRIETMQGWVSPRTGVILSTNELDLIIIRPDQQPFLNYAQLVTAPDEINAQRERAEAQRERAEVGERKIAELTARLLELGIDPESLRAGT
jgi:Uma2 family endonuclease